MSHWLDYRGTKYPTNISQLVLKQLVNQQKNELAIVLIVD